MKRYSLLVVLSVFLLVWLSFPTAASASGPWQWAARQQTVKVVGGWAYRLGSTRRMPYAKVVQELRQQGYVESGWSSVGGTKMVYYYFTKTFAVRAPAFPVILMAPGVFLQQVNPLYYPARTG